MSYMKRYLEDNPHICWNCDKAFKELLDLKAHQREYHGVESN